jgi:hypothetical protein
MMFNENEEDGTSMMFKEEETFLLALTLAHPLLSLSKLHNITTPLTKLHNITTPLS